MGRSILNFCLISFQLVLLCFFSNNMITATCQLSPNPLLGLACALVNCGEGTCTPSNTTLFGFECDCKPGWKQIQIGPLTFPSCLVPNCTINFQCGNGAPPPPPRRPPPPPQSTSNTSACNGVWCGDGNCVVNGTEHYCQCNEGSSNLLDQTAFACFKQCYFGEDCNSLGLGTPPPPAPAPPSTSSSSPKTGSNGAPNSLKNFQALIILALASIFLTWI